MMQRKIADYMTQKVLTVGPDEGIRRAFFFMREHQIKHLPVIDEGRYLLGMISDCELRRPDWVDEAFDIEHIYRLDDHLMVRDVMESKPAVLHTYDSLSKSVTLMIEQGKSALPVLNKSERLAGIVSTVDLLQVLADSLGHEK